jgi:iron complex outermembrane receptor protein
MRVSECGRWLALCCTALIATTTVAMAADQAVLEEVVVTAQKREQSAQDVPIAVTALSGNDLEQLGMVSAKDIATAVPNMLWAAEDSTNVANIYIRGVGDSSYHTNQVGGVGMYSDEISLNSPLLWNFGLFDLDRVEVLRGPQNTLFGRNTTGGAIQFESRKPRIGEEFDGYVSVNGGNHGRFDSEGAFEIPLGERLAVRLSAARFAQGDYLDNINLNRMEGGFERTAGRLQLLWQATDDLTALVNVHGGFFRGGSTRYKQIGLSDPKAPGFSNCPYLALNTNPGNGCSDQTGFVDSGNYTQESANSVDIFRINTHGALLRFDWKLPAFVVTSLTGYEHEDSERAEDSTGGPSFIFNFEQQTDSNQFSQEFRLTSTDSGPLKWIAGAYFFTENLDNTTDSRRANPILTNVGVPGVPVPETGVTSFIPFTILHQKDTAWSTYGQTELPLAQRLSFTAGLRFTSEKKSGLLEPGAVADTVPLFGPDQFIGQTQIENLLSGGTQVGPGPLPPQCPAPFPLGKCYELLPYSQTSNILGGKASLDYHLSDGVLVYGSVARGFKAGGISAAALDAIVGKGGSVVAPEFLWTYEIGMKSEWLEHRLRVNAAVFYNSWTNEQLFLVEPTPLGPNPVLTNVPKTISDGVDLDITAVPAKGWTVTVGGGLLHSEARDVGTILGAIRGSELIGAPKVTLSTIVRKQWVTGAGIFGLQADTHYTGATHWDLANTPVMIEPGYWIHNAAADYSFGPDNRYRVSIWGKNLTATQYCSLRSSLTGLGFGDVVECAPNEATRFFGLSARVDF